MRVNRTSGSMRRGEKRVMVHSVNGHRTRKGGNGGAPPDLYTNALAPHSTPLRPRASLARVQAQRLRKLSPKGSQSHGRFPLGIRTRVVHGPVSSDHQRGRCHRTVSERERSPVQAPVCCGAAGRVTKTVTTVSDSPLSRRVTASHRVIGNPAILRTRPHGTARHSQLPKLDVAGSIPVARSNDATARLSEWHSTPIAAC
jgi:hypothetical protein